VEVVEGTISEVPREILGGYVYASKIQVEGQHTFGGRLPRTEEAPEPLGP
jgi:hypothetical protein